MRIDDTLRAKFAELEQAGIKYDDQYDARLHWLELQMARFSHRMKTTMGNLEREIEELRSRVKD
jgi:hypothetical protein